MTFAARGSHAAIQDWCAVATINFSLTCSLHADHAARNEGAVPWRRVPWRRVPGFYLRACPPRGTGVADHRHRQDFAQAGATPGSAVSWRVRSRWRAGTLYMFARTSGKPEPPHGHRASSSAPCRRKGARLHHRDTEARRYPLEYRENSLCLCVSVVKLSGAVAQRNAGPGGCWSGSGLFRFSVRTEYRECPTGNAPPEMPPGGTASQDSAAFHRALSRNSIGNTRGLSKK